MVNNEYFNTIYDDTYSSTLTYVISKTDNLANVQDIMQDIYMNLYKTIVRKGPSYIKDPKNFVFRLAKAEIYKYYSVKNKVKYLFVSYGEEIENELFISKKIVFDESIIEDELVAEEIWKFISEQKLVVQKIMMLHYGKGLTLKEVAQKLSLNESTVKSNVYRTLDKIRERFGEKDD